MSKNLIVKKEKNKYFLYLNKKIFSHNSIKQVVEEEKEWVNYSAAEQQYVILEAKTDKKQDILELANYLLYLQRTN